MKYSELKKTNIPVFRFREVVDRGDADCRYVMISYNAETGRGLFREVNVCEDMPFPPVNTLNLKDLELAQD